jgi:hypothetical protein
LRSCEARFDSYLCSFKKASLIAFDNADNEMAVKGAIASKYRNAGKTLRMCQPRPGAGRRL